MAIPFVTSNDPSAIVNTINQLIVQINALAASSAALTIDLTDEVSLSTTGTYAGTHSYQPVGPDLNLDAAAGGAGKFLAAVMGNVIGDNLTQSNYTAGVIGAYSITTNNASGYPKGGVLGIAMDGSTDADGAVVAVVDGDSGALVVNAAFKGMMNNSTAGSGFVNGLDLNSATHDGYLALKVGADIFFNGGGTAANGVKVYSGAAVTRAAARAAVAASLSPTAPIGSLFVGVNAVATTKPNLYVKVANAGADTDWERVVTAATD